MRILGATLGDPWSAATYSGVPYHLFAELDKSGRIVGRLNADVWRPIDLVRGFVDLHRSVESRRPVRNAYWRFLPENMELQTRRLRPLVQNLPAHDAVLQIGVGGIPAKTGTLMAAHAEISVEAAATLEMFSKSYGFARQRDRLLARAIEGELEFLTKCDLIWTNTRWTAETFAHHGLPQDKFWIHAPACNADDPGPIERQADAPPHVLFSGKDWVRKGGPLLLEAFAMLRRRFPAARLTIMGCVPPVKDPGVEVIGFLDKKQPAEAARIDEVFRSATVFCMPSHWESVGLVYMEAALYGLPVVMLRGQGRELVFPESMAVHLDSPDADSLAEVLIHLHEDPEAAHRMGQAGRRCVLENYTWRVVAGRLVERMEAALRAGGQCR
ncbi:MAG: glycosyltransferase [Verrucomicrobiaceae bacterium]|nr:MAG: glycosyltransferase [Verrucomicrobiaceae bacterium]